MSALANNFKTKFAGLLRGMLRRMDGSEESGQQVTRPVAAAAPPPIATAPAAAPPPQAVEALASAPMPVRSTNMSELEMPLMPILEKLPPDLRSKWMSGGVNLSQASICISVEKVLPQLALGTVKITFGELRQAAPDLFRAGQEYDSLPIVLPLNDVLARLNPTLLARTPGQRTMAPPPEIAGPFGSGPQGVTGVAFTNTPLKQAPTPSTTHFLRKTAPPPETVKVAVPTPVTPPPPPFQRTTAPTAPAQMPPRVTTPIPMPQAPAPARSPIQTPIPQAPAPVRPSMPTPITPLAPAPMASPVPSRAPVPPPARIPFLKPVAPALAPAVSADIATLPVPLSTMAEVWPETLRVEIVQSNLAGAQVALPVHLVEPALKRGRVVFPWHQLRAWIRPLPPGPSIHDSMELELPLKVLAPLFLPRQSPEAKQRLKASLPPSSVPNLFFGFPQPQPEEMAPPLNAPDIVPLVKPADAKIAETDYYVWGDGNEAPRVDETDYKRPQTPATDFTSRRAMPNEIIGRAMTLPGVIGAIIALPDGLKVAHQLPPELNADTVAAFLPQLFSRVSQCSKELRMGELNNLNFTIGNVPWKIFRVNAVYFATFGRAGEPLPTAQLAQLAAELDRKK
jgi:predicted regulator of Ras-like GTPase activity (Roadblock/LC7/MglB family)